MMKFYKLMTAFLILMIPFALVGCGSGSDEVKKTNVYQTTELDNNRYNGEVYTFIDEDGVKCKAYGRYGGLSCDWSKRYSLKPAVQVVEEVTAE